MTSKQLILSAAIISLLLTGGSIAYANASDKQATTQSSVQSRAMQRGQGRLNENSNRFKNRKQMHKAFNEVRQAIENDDYQAWSELMKQRPHDPSWITQETFNKVKEMHALRLSGDDEAAMKIAEELGIEKFGSKRDARQAFRAVKEAITNKDYEAWAALMNDHPQYKGEVNQETFEKHVQIHDLMTQGKFAEANALRKELGIVHPFMNGRGMMQGVNGGFETPTP